MSEGTISRLQRLLEDIVQIGGKSEYTKIVPNRPVTDATPAGLANYVLVRDEGGYIIPAVKVPGVVYGVGDLVNLLIIKGTEPIAFQQGSATPSVHAAGHIIQDEAVDLTQRPRLNFTGAGVTATDDAINNRTDVTIPGGGGGWPFATVTVDLTDADADYTGATSLEDALAAEGAADYDVGPGTYALTATQLPAASSIRGKGKSGETVITGFTVAGDLIGLPTAGVAFVSDVRIVAEPAGGADGIGFEHNGGWLDSCEAIVTDGGGAGNMYGVFVNNGVTGHIYGGYINAPTACIYADTDSTVLLRNVPLLDTVGAFFAGAGTITGVFQDNSGNLYRIDGLAGTEVLLLSDHTHAGAGTGGQLDWDNIWADAVHDHSAAGEGGQLDWDSVWADAVHNHSSAAEGGDFGGWTDFTPAANQAADLSVTVNTARYKVAFGIAHVDVFLTATAAGTAGNAIEVTGIPAAIRPTAAGFLLGIGGVTDSGVAAYSGFVYDLGGGVFRFLNPAANPPGYVGVAPGVTLGNGDTIAFNISYAL